MQFLAHRAILMKEMAAVICGRVDGALLKGILPTNNVPRTMPTSRIFRTPFKTPSSPGKRLTR